MHERKLTSGQVETLEDSMKLSWVRVRKLAIEAGFTDAGVTALPHANQERDAARFDEWIARGRAGSMLYLERRNKTLERRKEALERCGEGSRDGAGELVRARVRTPFPWARSAIVCWASYDSGEPRSIDVSDPGAGWIARYAWTSQPAAKPQTVLPEARNARRPSDYHRVLVKRLHLLEEKLRAEYGQFESRAYVDTGPIVERTLAVAAGLGWTAKNTCVIHPKLGSFGFLAVLLTSLVSESASQQGSESAADGNRRLLRQQSVRSVASPFLVPDRCGSCTRCIEACPTGALVAPYQMDARRCISYLTIEHKAPIAEELMEQMGRQVFGCDICQDVCPWNSKAQRDRKDLCYPTLSANNAERMGHPTVDSELEPRPELVNPALDWLASLDEKSFEQLFNGSPVRRAGFNGSQRNMAIAMGNSGLAHFAPKLEEWAAAADESLRMAARWALGKLRGE